MNSIKGMVTLLFFLVILMGVSNTVQAQDCEPKPNPEQCNAPPGCGAQCGLADCVTVYSPCATAAYSQCQSTMTSCNGMAMPGPREACKVQAAQTYVAQEKQCYASGSATKAALQTMPCTDQLLGGAIKPCDQCRLKANCDLTKKQLESIDMDSFLKQAAARSQPMNMDNLMKMAGLLQGFMQQGQGDSGGVSATPGGDFRPTVFPDGDTEFGGNVFNRDQLNGQEVNFNTKDGSLTFSKEGQSVTVLRNPNPNAGLDRVTLPDEVIAPGGFAAQITRPDQSSVVLHPGSTVTDPTSRALRITNTGQQGSLPPPIIGQWMYGTRPAFTLVRFFPDDPPLATLNEVTVGRLPPSIIKIVPRSNVKIDLFAGQAVISSLVQQFGLPRGLSAMANPKNLRAESNNKFDVEGRGDFDFLLANGLVRWTRSGTPGGKIIASSFGVPPDQYLSSQQRELLYGGLK